MSSSDGSSKFTMGMGWKYTSIPKHMRPEVKSNASLPAVDLLPNDHQIILNQNRQGMKRKK